LGSLCHLYLPSGIFLSPLSGSWARKDGYIDLAVSFVVDRLDPPVTRVLPVLDNFPIHRLLLFWARSPHSRYHRPRPFSKEFFYPLDPNTPRESCYSTSPQGERRQDPADLPRDGPTLAALI